MNTKSVMMRSLKISILFTLILTPLTVIATVGLYSGVLPWLIYTIGYLVTIFLGTRYNNEEIMSEYHPNLVCHDAYRLSTKIILVALAGLFIALFVPFMGIVFGQTISSIFFKEKNETAVIVSGIVSVVLLIMALGGILFSERENNKRRISAIPLLTLALGVSVYFTSKMLYVIDSSNFFEFYSSDDSETILLLFFFLVEISVVVYFLFKLIIIPFFKWIFK